MSYLKVVQQICKGFKQHRVSFDRSGDYRKLFA
jgi:hypothetical protein